MNYEILEDVYIGYNSIIFDKNKNILDLHPYRQNNINKESLNFENYDIKVLPENEYVDLTHYYGHWPFAHRYDSLSRIRHVESIVNKNTNYLIGVKTQGYSKNRFDEECGLFGVMNKTYHPNGNTLFKVKKLIYPTWVFKPGVGNESPVQFTQESFDYCRNKYTKYFKENKEKYKLFLTRTNNRKIINHEEVHKFFIDLGFIILYGTEDMETTINYFYNANLIIGIHGGLFSNVIFCNKIDKIIEVFSREYKNYCFVGWEKFLNVKSYNTMTFDSIDTNINLNFSDLNDIIK